MQPAEGNLPGWLWKLTLISLKSPQERQPELTGGRQVLKALTEFWEVLRAVPRECEHSLAASSRIPRTMGVAVQLWKGSARSPWESYWYSASGNCCGLASFLWPGARRNKSWLTKGSSATVLYYPCSQTWPPQMNLELGTQESRQEVCKWWVMNLGSRLAPTEAEGTGWSRIWARLHHTSFRSGLSPSWKVSQWMSISC